MTLLPYQHPRRRRRRYPARDTVPNHHETDYTSPTVASRRTSPSVHMRPRPRDLTADIDDRITCFDVTSPPPPNFDLAVDPRRRRILFTEPPLIECQNHVDPGVGGCFQR